MQLRIYHLMTTLMLCGISQNAISQCTGLGSITFNVVAATAPTLSFPSTVCIGQPAVIGVNETFSTYAWSSGGSTQSINVNLGGTYTVTVTNSAGCSSTAQAVLNNAGLSFGLTTTSLGCDLFINGPQGGITSYVWSTGQSALTSIQATTSGTYTLTVTETSGCTASSSITVTVGSASPLSVTSNGSICSGSSNTLTATTGFATYAWSPGATGSGNTAIVTSSGTYTVTATSANGCSNTQSIVVTANTPPTPTLAPVAIPCAGQNTTLSVNNGPFVSYAWTGGGSSPSISVSTPGVYTVTITDANGCTGTSSASVTVNTLPSPNITVAPYTCNGIQTLQASPSFSSYAWSNLQSGASNSVNISGTYTVTVTDANGCTNTATSTVTILPLPVVNITGNALFCAGASTSLTATAGFSAYSWSGGLSNTNQATITSAGTYTVTVTDVLGCTGTESTTVNTNPAANPAITALAPICAGETADINLSNGPFTSYNWSTGEGTPGITVSLTGTYTVTVTNANGCTGTASSSLVVNPAPALNVSPQPYTCNNTLTLAATTGLSGYTWSNGQSGQTILISSNGVYTVTATGGNGCSSIASFTATIPSLPTATVVGGGQICAGESATLIAPSGFANYIWTSGQNTQSISVSTNGTYFVTVSDALGCTAVASASVTVTPAPVVSINGPTSICSGGTATYSINAPFSSYTWSNGSSASSITVSNPGNYSVVVSDANGCTNNASINLAVGNSVSVPINAVPYNCDGQIILTVGSGFSTYAWSNGASSPTISVNTSGTYSVTVNTASGCTGTSSTLVNIPTSQNVSITAPAQICNGTTATLDASSGFASYAWSNGILNQSTNITTGGTYTVTATDSNGCTAISTANVLPATAPQPQIIGPNTICANSQATLTLQGVGPGNSITWSTGQTTPSILVGAGNYDVTVTNNSGCDGSDNIVINLSGSLSPNIAQQPYNCNSQITINAGSGFTTYAWSNGISTQTNTIATNGTYTVTVSDASSCTGSATLAVTIPQVPSVSITGASAFCAGASVTLSASAGFANYAWSNGIALPQISTNTSGTYTITATDANGCTATASQTITGGQQVLAQITGSTSLCNGSNTTLALSQSFTTYAWSTGNNTPTLSVNTAGTYTVTVTDANGCTGSDDVSVAVSTSLSPNIAQQPYNCNSQITINAGSGFTTYAWSNGISAQTNTIATNGTYTVTVSDASGCTGSATLAVTIPQVPSVSITGASAFCAGASVTLSASAGFANYAWSNGIALPQISTNTSGTYTITATDFNGCTATASQTITGGQPVLAQITGSTSLCNGSNTTLALSQSFTTYAWSTGNNTPTLSVNTAGTYTVTVTDANGCTGSDNVTVAVSTSLSPNIAQQPYNCNSQITINAGSGFTTYAWSNGISAQTNTIATNGTYTVTVSDASGCTGSATLAVTIPQVPSVSITGASAFCAGASVTLSASAGFANYAWSNGIALPQISATVSGTYTITVTDSNGCTATASQTITGGQQVLAQITGSTSLCNGSNTTLALSQNFTTYAWSTGDNTPTLSVNTAGTYTVTVTDANGCTGSDNVIVAVSTSLSPNIAQQPYNCNSQITINAGSGFTTYAWSNGISTQTNTIATNGTYTVTVSDASGCTGSATLAVTIPQVPSVSITGASAFCAGASVTLSASAGFANYAWSNGIALPQISTNTSGTYTITATDSNGCTATTSQTITGGQQVLAQITGSTSLCNGSNTTLALSQNFTTYAWSTGDNTPTLSVNTAGIYTVTVTDANGCTGSDNVSVVTSANIQLQAVQLPYQCNGSITIDAGAGFTNYLWSNGTNGQTLSASQNGSYTVTVSNATGCTGSAQSVVVLPSQPSVEINGNTAICAGASTTLSINVTNATTYLWSNGSNALTISTTVIGAITVTVTDATGCTATDQILTTAAPAINAFASQIANCSGSLAVTASGTPNAVAYTWSNGANIVNPTVQSPGIYTVTVTSTDGCTATATTTVTPFTPPNVSINASASTFCNNASATLVASSAGFTNYAWSTGQSSTNQIIVSESGTYTLTITDASGCTGTAQTSVTENPLPEVEITGDFSLDCYLTGASMTAQTVNSGAPATAWNWSNGQTTNQIAPNTVGLYTVTLTDANGCSNTASINVNLSVTSEAFADTIKFEIGEEVALIPPFQLNDATFTWTTQTLLDCDTCSTALAKPTQNSLIGFSAETIGGCLVTGSFYLVTEREQEIMNYFFPNVIALDSPNNNTFTIYASDAQARIRMLRVYTRWGEMVASLPDLTPGDLSQGWRGEFRDRLVNPGVFIWTAEVVNASGEVELLKGDLTVIR